MPTDSELDPYRKSAIEIKVVEECTSCNKRRMQRELRTRVWKKRLNRWLGYYARFAHFAPVASVLVLVLSRAYGPFDAWATHSESRTRLFVTSLVLGTFGLFILAVWWGMYIFANGSDDE